MKKEVLERAKEIEQQVKYYNEIAYAMTYPWQRFKLNGKHAYIGATKHPYNIEISLNDHELAKLIEDYCRDRIKKLNKELEEL